MVLFILLLQQMKILNQLKLHYIDEGNPQTVTITKKDADDKVGYHLIHIISG